MKTMATALLTLLIGFTGCATFSAEIPLPDGTVGKVASREIFILSRTDAATFANYVFPDGSYLEIGRGTSRRASEAQNEIVKMAYEIGKASMK